MGANKQPVIGSGVLPYVAPSEDTTAPTVTAASINTAGDTLTLTFSESVTGGTGFDVDGWTLGAASGSGSTRTFSISPTVLDTDTPALDYTPGNVQDASGNALEAFVNAVIYNGSMETGGGGTMTLSEHLADQIDSRIAVPGKVDDIYAAYPARNTNCWAADVDLTCMCVEGNGVLIAPDVILDAGHLYSGLPNGDLSDVTNGQTRTFVDASGVEHTVTVADSGNLELAPNNFSSDIFLMRLTSPVPAGITFAKVAPENFRSLLDLTAHAVPIVIATNGAAMNVSDLSWNRAYTHIGYEQPVDAARLSLYQDFFGGISGSPGFAIFEGELICLGTAHTETPDEVFFPTYYKTLVNARMTELGSAFSLTEAVMP